jgi:hypothetical protein
MSTTYVLFGCFYLVILLLFSELITIFFTIFFIFKGRGYWFKALYNGKHSALRGRAKKSVLCFKPQLSVETI